MPSTVTHLLSAAGLTHAEAVPWGTSPATTDHGVYLVARVQDPDDLGEVRGPVFDHDALQRLRDACPDLMLDGASNPTPQALSDRLRAFWPDDEPVLYVGKADVPIRKRVQQYYRTPIGARSPHKGGWFLKMLADLDALWVHLATSAQPKDDEEAILGTFADGMSGASLDALADPEKPMPFANLQRRRGGPKRHGIRNATTAS